MKIIINVGALPQLIKIASLVRAILEQNKIPSDF